MAAAAAFVDLCCAFICCGGRSVWFSKLARERIVFFVSSHNCNDGILSFGGLVKMEMMSVVAC